jgi:hypothetical protein
VHREGIVVNHLSNIESGIESNDNRHVEVANNEFPGDLGCQETLPLRWVVCPVRYAISRNGNDDAESRRWMKMRVLLGMEMQ